MGRKASPARQRYEAARPTVTARVSAEVKARLDAVLQAQGLTFSAWVAAQAVGVANRHERANAVARAAGYREGLAEGRAQGRAVYLIVAAAMLWDQYGGQLGDTNDAWVDRRAMEVVRGLTPGQRAFLRGVLERTPRLAHAVARWLQDSDLPALHADLAVVPPVPVPVACKAPR